MQISTVWHLHISKVDLISVVIKKFTACLTCCPTFCLWKNALKQTFPLHISESQIYRWLTVLKSVSNQVDRRLSVMSTWSFPSAPLAVTCICWLSHYRTKCRYKDRGGLDSIKHLSIMKTRHIQHVSSRTPGTEGRGGTTQTPSSYLFSVPCLLSFSFFFCFPADTAASQSG